MLLRILHLRNTSFIGGPERQLIRHAILARERGLDVRLASYCSPTNAEPELLRHARDHALPVSCIPQSGSYDPRVIGRLRALLKEQAITIVGTHDYRSAILAMFACRATNVGWLAFSRGYTNEGLKVGAFQVLETLVMHRANRIAAVSEAQARRLIRYGVPRRRLRVVPNAVDIEALSRITPFDLRLRFGFPRDCIVVVSAGRFTREKGHLDLVKAAKIATQREPRLRFVLLGDGQLREKIESLTARLGLADLVRLPGFEHEVEKALKGADIVVNPSLSEGMPNVVLEALAMERPVVATAVGGVPELIPSADCGVVVPPSDPATLARAIVTTAESPKTAQERAQNGRLHVEQDYSFTRQYERLLAVYAELDSGCKDN